MKQILIFGFMAAVIVILVLIVGLITQWAWQWTVPDIFSGAVSKGILPASLEFGQALKLSIFISLLFGGSRASSSKK